MSKMHRLTKVSAFFVAQPRRNISMMLLTDVPPECTSLSLSSIFRFAADPNQFYIPHRLVPLEGRLAIVTDAGRDAVDPGGVRRANEIAVRVMPA
jgi:hypothetical protein